MRGEKEKEKWMFSSRSDLQARCLSPKGGGSGSAETPRNSAQSPLLQTAVGGLGVGDFPPHPTLGFSSKISQKSTVVRMDEELHARQLAGGMAYTHNKGSTYCYCFITINKGNSCQN